MGPDFSHVTRAGYFPPSTITVLFIDPNEEERQNWANGLASQSSEYVVLQAASGQAGLTLVKQEAIDCVVLELHLPDKNGLSVLFDLAGNPHNPQIAVVVLTNFPLDALSQLAIQNGAKSCMRKDRISVENLDMAIRKAIAIVGPHKGSAA